MNEETLKIIANQKKGVESAETAKIHNSAENSVLASFANNMSQIFSRLLRIYLEWSTGSEIDPESVKVKINTDFDVATMSATELTALVSLWQSGGIAKSDLFRNLKEGEILDADRQLDEMNAEIDEEQQALDEKAKKVKIQHDAVNTEPRKKSDKPRTVKVSDVKKELFSQFSQFLTKFCEENPATYSILTENKLFQVNFGGETFKIDIVQQRKPKQ